MNTNNSLNIQFQTNLAAWNRETAFLSVGNFSNKYFDEIVKMQQDAVPFIEQPKCSIYTKYSTFNTDDI